MEVVRLVLNRIETSAATSDSTTEAISCQHPTLPSALARQQLLAFGNSSSVSNQYRTLVLRLVIFCLLAPHTTSTGRYAWLRWNLARAHLIPA